MRQLSPTQFADAIGIARPIMSHILSGRNKPSLEVVQKVIGAFPELSLAWLLSGSGEMLTAAPPGPSQRAPEPTRPPEAVVAPKKPRPAALAPPEPVSTAGSPAAQQRPLDLAAAPAPVEEQAPAESTALVAPAPSPVLPVAPPPPPVPVVADSAVQALAASLGEPGKAIRRIVIFYHDGTFAAYQPE